MNDIQMILCGSIEKSRSDENEKVGVVSVVYVSTDETKVKAKLEELKKQYPGNFYMEYSVPLDVELTALKHYPSIEISGDDLR